MSYQLNFDEFLTYNVGDESIGLDVEIRFGDSNVKLNAKIDTGSTYSIFERKFGAELGLEIESGMRQRFGTATGNFYGYGFRVTLITADLEFDSMVFFAEDDSFATNVLGRIGWLDKVILGLVDYEGKLYLSHYLDE
jgi:Aspartyl protease